MLICKNCYSLFETPINSTLSGRDHYVDGKECPACGEENFAEANIDSEFNSLSPEQQIYFKGALTAFLTAVGYGQNYTVSTPAADFTGIRRKSGVDLTITFNRRVDVIV